MNIHLFDVTQAAVDISRATSVEFEMRVDILKYSYWNLLFFYSCYLT